MRTLQLFNRWFLRENLFEETCFGRCMMLFAQFQILQFAGVQKSRFCLENHKLHDYTNVGDRTPSLTLALPKFAKQSAICWLCNCVMSHPSNFGCKLGCQDFYVSRVHIRDCAFRLGNLKTCGEDDLRDQVSKQRIKKADRRQCGMFHSK